MSKSVPFLLAPSKTKGWVGDVEFDPFGFSDLFEMKWLREAELKHGRAAMLATVGFWQQEHLTLPGMTPVPISIDAPGVVGAGVMLQIIFWGGGESQHTKAIPRSKPQPQPQLIQISPPSHGILDKRWQRDD